VRAEVNSGEKLVCLCSCVRGFAGTIGGEWHSAFSIITTTTVAWPPAPGVVSLSLACTYYLVLDNFTALGNEMRTVVFVIKHHAYL